MNNILVTREKEGGSSALENTFLHNKTIFAWTFLPCDVFFSPTYNELPPKIRLKSCENYRGLPPPSYFETSTSPLPLLKSILLLPVIKILLFRGAAKNKGGGMLQLLLFSVERIKGFKSWEKERGKGRWANCWQQQQKNQILEEKKTLNLYFGSLLTQDCWYMLQLDEINRM